VEDSPLESRETRRLSEIRVWENFSKALGQRKGGRTDGPAAATTGCAELKAGGIKVLIRKDIFTKQRTCNVVGLTDTENAQFEQKSKFLGKKKPCSK